MADSFINTRDENKELKDQAKQWAKAQDGGWWSSLWSELPMDIAENSVHRMGFNPLVNDEVEARRKKIRDDYFSSQNPSQQAKDAWSKLLNSGEY